MSYPYKRSLLHRLERVFGLAQDGTYLDVAHRCKKWVCEECWKIRLYEVAKASKIVLRKLGNDYVWVGLLTDADRRTARHYKERTDGVLDALVTYQQVDTAGVIATHNLVPSRDVMEQMTIDDAIYRWTGWGLKYRPKRVRADWDLTLPSTFEGMFTASPKEITQLWKVLGDRYNYKPGDAVEDQVAFERRAYGVLDEIRSSNAGNEPY